MSRRYGKGQEQKRREELEKAFDSLAQSINKAEHDKKWFEPQPFRYHIQEWNTECEYYFERNGEPGCDIHMDMVFCTKNCAWASNNSLAIKPKRKGKETK